MKANAPNKAGIAALTLIEEIDTLKPEVLAAAYEQANEWLVNCYNQGLLLRFKTAGMKLARELRHKTKNENTKDLLFNRLIRLPDEVLKFERDLISTALAKANRRVTYAAKLLGIRYPKLASIIESRHPDLLKERTPVYRRSRKE
jgi:transcriptional regulator with GAF, ATPase, and Fis domain